MIKIVFCLRRRKDVAPEEFHGYWVGEHPQLVRRHSAALRIGRYTQSHAINHPQLSGALAARGSGFEPFDGVAKLWWESAEDVAEANASREGRAAGRALLDDEPEFIDLVQSAIFFTEEQVVIGG